MPIVFSEVGYQYAQGLPWERIALRNINLQVEKNEMLGIIGPTGSGKTTLLQLMNGILTASQGQVLINGANPANMRGTEMTRLRRQVGLVFQSPEDQLFENQVYDDIAFGPRNLGLTGSELDNRVKWAMEMLELDFASLSERKPQSLSGGQKRRVAIAGLLAIDPEYLILDEPGAGLDYEGRLILLSVINKLCRVEGKGIVLVSHRLQDVFGTVDRVVVLVDGKIAMEGSPRDILARGEQLEELGIELPASNQVLQRLTDTMPQVSLGMRGVVEVAGEINRCLRSKL
ncbi:MAG: energy-coupling factor transporter ATPase [Syntrophomonadaceae bacterium]|nr:energy-coupling factor transporter ATPase [Syntrophomonadaceae bacterium]